jgi:hypothetical protein
MSLPREAADLLAPVLLEGGEALVTPVDAATALGFTGIISFPVIAA